MSRRTVGAHLSAYFRADRREAGDRFLPLLVSVGAILCVSALAGVTWAAGTGPVLQAVHDADWPYLLLAPLAVVVSHAGYTVAFRQAARAGPGDGSGSRGAGPLGTKDVFAIVTVGFGPISPRGGYALDTVELRRRGLSKRQAERRVRVLGLLEYAVLAPAALGAASYLTAEGIRAQTGLLPSWMIGVPTGSAVTLLLLRRYRRAGRPTNWWAPVRHLLDSVDDLLRRLASWPAGAIALSGILVYWTGEIAALTACLDVFAHRRGAIALMIVGYATGYALTRRCLPLGGAGLVEALLPFALSWIGFPLAQAVAAVIAYRVITLWLALVPAYVALRHLRDQDRGGRPEPGRRRSAFSVAPAAGRSS